MSDDRTTQARALNDALRSTFMGGRVLVTSGISALGTKAVAAVLDRVRTFTDFTEGNDSNGEHDFGTFEIGGNRFFSRSTTTTPPCTPAPKIPAIRRTPPVC